MITQLNVKVGAPMKADVVVVKVEPGEVVEAGQVFKLVYYLYVCCLFVCLLFVCCLFGFCYIETWSSKLFLFSLVHL